MSANLENSAMATRLEKVSLFHSNPKKNAMSKNVQTTAKLLPSHTLASKVKLKIFQARLQHYVNHDLPDVQAGFRKGWETRDQIANMSQIIKKQESSRKISTSALLSMLNPLTVCISTNWKILKEIWITDHLICLWRNLYAGQEATVRIVGGATNWFQIRKGVRQGHILSPCLLNLYAEYIMQNAGQDEAQAEIKTARRNINNFRYAGDTTLIAESKE